MTHYLSVLHEAKDGSYGVSFPDFPGCISAGDTLDDALHQGAEALSFHVEGLREDGEALPVPSDANAIRAGKIDWVDLDGAILAPIPLLPSPGQTVRVQLTIDSRLLSRIDAVTSNRSAFLAEAAENVLVGKKPNKRHSHAG